MNIKVGHGIDIHQLKKGVPLILAGLTVKSKLGIVGHSDGDVVIHAIVDAILGALAKGDIGTFFPSEDDNYKNCKSTVFLDKALSIMKEEKYQILNVDINIILEKPHLNSHILSMRKNLSNFINIDIGNISIKATTSDHLGFIGEQKGIMSTATILLIKRK